MQRNIERIEVVLHVPPGPIGAVLAQHTPTTNGYSFVSSVNQFSPMFGLLQPGDWIKTMDFIPLRNWNVQEIRSLLVSKANQQRRLLCVLRAKEKAPPYTMALKISPLVTPPLVTPPLVTPETTTIATTTLSLNPNQVAMQERMKRAREYALKSVPASQQEKKAVPKKATAKKSTSASPKNVPNKRKEITYDTATYKKRAKAASNKPSWPPPSSKTPTAAAAKEKPPSKTKPPPPKNAHRPDVKEKLVKAFELWDGANALKALDSDALEGRGLARKRLKRTYTEMQKESDSILETYPESALNNWERMLRRLVLFRKEHGHTTVPLSFEDKYLASWVGRQRMLYRTRDSLIRQEAKKQREDDIGFLNRLGFCWRALTTQARPWHELYDRLKEFVEKKGHARVPQLYEPDKGLGNWVHSQRKEYEKLQEGKTSYLNEDKIKLLEDVEFQWKLRKGRPKKTDPRYRNKRWPPTGTATSSTNGSTEDTSDNNGEANGGEMNDDF